MTTSTTIAAPNTGSFRVGLIQMRSGREPQANFAAAAELIREAANAGAHYVLTPEMTNIMETSRERLFSVIRTEDEDASVAEYRSLARELGLYLHVGSL